MFLDEDPDDTLRKAWGGDVTETLARGLYGSRRVVCELSPSFDKTRARHVRRRKNKNVND